MKSVKTAYKHYKEKYKDTDVSWEEYRDVNYLFNKKVADKLMNGLRVVLPHWMGVLQIRKSEVDPEKAPIDFNQTRLARLKDPKAPVIKHFNFHSDGYVARVSWIKRYSVTNVSNYVFYPARGNKGDSLLERLVLKMKEFGGHKKFIKK